MTWLTWVAWLSGAMLGVAGVLALVRATLGPSMPDRAVALDVFVAVFIAGLGVEAAYNEHTDTLPILVVLSLVGMVGTVSIARYATGDPAEPGSEAGRADSDEPERRAP